MENKKTDYQKFLLEYFPKSYAINDRAIEKIYQRVCENNLITEIFKIKIEERKLKCCKIFLLNYQIQFNKLLIYIGLNDPTGIDFCIRSSVENLLKFIYSIHSSAGDENINKTSFRHIKEGFKEFNSAIINSKELQLNVLFNYYGRYSNSIHYKNDNFYSSLNCMEDIIKSKNYDLNKLDKSLLGILNAYEQIISCEIELISKSLSSAELIRLKNNLSKIRYNKFMDSIS